MRPQHRWSLGRTLMSSWCLIGASRLIVVAWPTPLLLVTSPGSTSTVVALEGMGGRTNAGLANQGI